MKITIGDDDSPIAIADIFKTNRLMYISAFILTVSALIVGVIL